MLSVNSWVPQKNTELLMNKNYITKIIILLSQLKRMMVSPLIKLEPSIYHKHNIVRSYLI